MTLEEEFERATKEFNRLAGLIVRKREGLPCADDHYWRCDYVSIYDGVKTENFVCLVCGDSRKSHFPLYQVGDARGR